MEKTFQYKTTITSQHRLFDLHIRETFRYRDLIILFVKRDFTAMYKQTILGPLWAVIQPLLTTVVFTIIFGRLAKLTTADTPGNLMIPGFLFYMAGNICWGYFSATINGVSNVFLLSTVGWTDFVGMFQPDFFWYPVCDDVCDFTDLFFRREHGCSNYAYVASHSTSGASSDGFVYRMWYNHLFRYYEIQRPCHVDQFWTSIVAVWFPCRLWTGAGPRAV